MVSVVASGNPHSPKGAELTLTKRILGAWLWSKRRAVITGVAASALHGAEWVDADIPIELRLSFPRPPRGIVARNETLFDDEMMYISDLPVTTPARTAFDLGRHLKRGQALARLDALMRARPFSIEDVKLLAKRYRGARGIRQLRELLPLVDGGAASPQETRLRLLFIDNGFPKPTTQIPVFDEWGFLVRTLDMGWEDFMVGAEYDGDQHRTDRGQYVKDLKVWPELARLGLGRGARHQGGLRPRHHPARLRSNDVTRLEALILAPKLHSGRLLLALFV